MVIRRAALVAAVTAVALAGCTSGAHHHGTVPPSPSGPGTATTGRPTSTPNTHAATSTPPAQRSVTVLGSGDVLIHPQLWQQARADARAEGRPGYDFGPMYASVAPDVRAAGLAICEMETPLAPPGGPFRGWPDFSAPPQVLTALKGIGYDTCTTASNHTLDQGYGGVRRTLDELDAAGLRHTGSYRTEHDAHAPFLVHTPSGITVGQLAYSFDFNGITPPAGKPWIANRIDVPAIRAAAERLKAAGADVVVLSMHWGVEYDHKATAEQRSQARRLLASPDIDVIFGDHAHVVQPAERLHGKWVFYCMGNQISRHADPIAASREGLMPRVTFTEASPHHVKITSVEAVPTWMADRPKLRLIDLPRALASSGLTTEQRNEYRTAHSKIVEYLDAYGARHDGLVIR